MKARPVTLDTDTLHTPTERGHFGLAGLKASTPYLVEVAFNANNPVHRAVMLVGFVDKQGQPGNYTRLYNNTWERTVEPWELYYLKVLGELGLLEVAERSDKLSHGPLPGP